ALRGAGPGPADNERVLRHLAKVTINPAVAHGLAGHVGSLEPGKLGDVVLWQPHLFGVRPELVLKSGVAAARARCASTPARTPSRSTASRWPLRRWRRWRSRGATCSDERRAEPRR